MALGDTSLPVPDVVGRQAHHKPRRSTSPVPKQSAADAGDAVGSERARLLDDPHDLIEGRFGRDAVVDAHFGAALFDPGHRVGDERTDRRRRQQEEFAESVCKELVGESLGGTLAEHDARGLLQGYDFHGCMLLYAFRAPAAGPDPGGSYRSAFRFLRYP